MAYLKSDAASARRALPTFAALLTVALAAPPAFAAVTTWNVKLTGGAEAPTPGDASASGTAKISVDDSSDYLCYDISTSGIAKATMAHIHKAAKGAAGPVVVPLETPLGGASKACAMIDATLAKSILANPSDYYVNVHSDKFPQGAIRAQLAG